VAAYQLTPPQKILSAKIRWKNYQCRVLLICAGAIEGHFEGEMPW